jgi:hypothetical protein
MIIIFIIICLAILGAAFAYIDRENVQKRQTKIEKDLADLKTLIEAENYRDKKITDKMVGEVEI